MVRINIRLEKRYIKKDGRSTLKIAVHSNGKTLYADTNIYIKAEDWDKDNQRILGAQNRGINAILQRKKADMEERLLILQNKGQLKTLTDKQLINYLVGISEDDKPHYFKDVLEKFVSTKTNTRTQEIYKATVNKLVQFCDYDHITFEEMNVSWLRSFEAWLAQTSPSANSRSIHLRNIRTIFNAALDDELITAYPFRRFKITNEETIKRSISIEEMRKLLHIEVQPFQQKYLDCFFLSFYLIGINTVDLSKLPVDADSDGRIIYKRSKTGKLYDIRIEPEAAHIINKYRGKIHLLKWFDDRKDYRTFTMYLDKNLQLIGRSIGILSLTTYVARHSWASYASELDIPKDVISHALGHHTNVTDTYIRFNNCKIDEANRRVIDYLLM